MPFDITGIRRSPEFSPNHVDNDWLILKLTAEEFRRRGYAVQLIGEAEVGSIDIDSPVIFNMCQGARANRLLQEVKSRGRLIINPPGGVLNCHRHHLVSILQQVGLPFPRSFLIETSDGQKIPEEALALGRLWVKRGDVHATGPGDVVFVKGQEEVRRVLESFRTRGIPQAVLQEHIEGATIKFYAVRQDSFFQWYPLSDDRTIRLDPGELYRWAEAAAEALDLQIYGGDGIATPDGKLTIIDINDWPSYARFREVAAGCIARHILRRAREDGKL